MNAVKGFDFTIPEDAIALDDLKNVLKDIGDEFAFQLEEGKSGYRHWQGRIHLQKKTRLSTLVRAKRIPKAHWSITSSTVHLGRNFNYVLKDETRIGKPYTSKDEKIPEDIKGITKFLPWQEQLFDKVKKYDARSINLLYCPEGNTGKTVFMRMLTFYHGACFIPAVNDYKDIMGVVCSKPSAALYVIDLPRAMNKKYFSQMYSAVETIKDGYAFDTRYSFKEKYFKRPNIIVCTNTLPDPIFMSADRWNVWTVEKNMLTKFD